MGTRKDDAHQRHQTRTVERNSPRRSTSENSDERSFRNLAGDRNGRTRNAQTRAQRGRKRPRQSHKQPNAPTQCMVLGGFGWFWVGLFSPSSFRRL